MDPLRAKRSRYARFKIESRGRIRGGLGFCAYGMGKGELQAHFGVRCPGGPPEYRRHRSNPAHALYGGHRSKAAVGSVGIGSGSQVTVSCLMSSNVLVFASSAPAHVCRARWLRSQLDLSRLPVSGN